MQSSLVLESTVEPITLAEVKTHLRVDIDTEDDYITALISSARQIAERITHRELISRTLNFKLHGFPVGDMISLPRAPLASVSEITYIDPDGVQQTLATSVYDVSADYTSPYIYLKYNQSWPATRNQFNAVTIQAVMGYAYDTDASPSEETSNIPVAIKTALKIMVRKLYDKRGESEVGAKGSTEWNILAPFRRKSC